MKLIVGLGNPGEKYANNRHNVGFQFIDYLINGLRINELKKDKYSNSQFVNTLINNEQCILMKPLTFMNNSGVAVSIVLNNYHLPLTNLIVVHDDLDIPLSKFKIQKGVGPKLHNGLESIENHLHTKDFLRVRIGVDNRPSNDPTRKNNPAFQPSITHYIPGEIYALQDFTNEERNLLQKTFPKIWKRLSPLAQNYTL